MKKSYKHIFIDLDKTLWDFESNSLEAFKEIYAKYEMEENGIPNLDAFLDKYHGINTMLWSLYRENKIKKEVLNVKRFDMTLNELGIEDLVLATHIAEDYISISPKKTNLFPGSREGLDWLNEKGYELHIITNGFDEVQFPKLRNTGLMPYFNTVTTSEEAGVKKPEPGIFDLALERASANPFDSIMIGDDLHVDIAGARNFGMDQIWFNPEKHGYKGPVTFEISSWKEIEKIL